MVKAKKPSRLKRSLERVSASFAAVGLTAVFFLVLPIIQAISSPAENDLVTRQIESTNIPPPPPPPVEEEPEKEDEEPEEMPPELSEQAPPLDLSQLELALNLGSGPGFGGDFGLQLQTLTTDQKEEDALFSLADLDQKPRVIYQPSPILTASVRRKAPGTVYILFMVDEQGRVREPRVHKSTDPVFEKPAMDAIKKWRFEPGKRKGKPVQFKMRVPITFPKR